MVGRAVSLFPKVEAPVGEVLLEVRDLTRRETFNGVSFAVRAGEIVGMAGLVGAGRTEVARVLFGIDRPERGEILLGGKPVDVRQPVRGDARRDRLRPRGPPPGRARPRLHDRVERDPADPAAAVPGPVRPGLGRASDRPALRRPAPDPGDRRRPARVGPVRRQPAEGRPRQMAGDRATDPHPRRADPRHRHRGQGRGPPDHLRARRVRARASC